LAGAAVVLALIGCDGSAPQQLDVVTIAARRHLSAGPIHIADEEGFFAAEGIRVVFAEAPTRSMQALPLLEQGKIDVLSTSVNAGLFSSGNAGTRFRIVADRGHVTDKGCDFNAIIGRRESFPTDSPTTAQLRGKKLSVNSAVSAEFIIDKFLESRGLQDSDMEKLSLSDVMEPEAIRNGGLDVTHAAEPYLTQFKETGQRVIGRAAVVAPGAVYGVIIFGPTLTVANRPLGERFMAAYLKGVRQYEQGPTARNVGILAARMQYDSTMLRKACFSAIDPNGRVDTRWFDQFQEWALKRKYIDRVLPLTDIVDSAFAHNASARLDSVNRAH